jgi:hypothetical protein
LVRIDASAGIVGAVRDGLWTQGNQVDDLFSRDRPLSPDHIENDAPVEGRA